MSPLPKPVGTDRVEAELSARKTLEISRWWPNDSDGANAINDPVGSQWYWGRGAAHLEHSGAIVLLEADLSRLAPSQSFGAGNWVLAMHSEVTAGDVPEYIDLPALTPFIARVRIGTGRFAYEVDVDANCTFSLPSQKVRVSLVAEPRSASARISHYDGGKNYVWSGSQTVEAHLLRGTSVSGKAKRTQWLPPNVDAGDAPPDGELWYPGPASGFAFYAVPKFARRVRLHLHVTDDPIAQSSNARIEFTDASGRFVGYRSIWSDSSYGPGLIEGVDIPANAYGYRFLIAEGVSNPPGNFARALEWELSL